MRSVVVTLLIASSLLLFTVHCGVVAQSSLWTKVPGPDGGNVIRVASNSKGLMLAQSHSSRLFLSENNGEQWNEIASPPLLIQALAITKAGKLFATGYNGFYLSEDRGRSWSLVKDTVYTMLMAGPDGTLYAATPIDGVFVSYNNGHNWRRVREGLPRFQVSDKLAVSDDGTIYLLSRGKINIVYRLDNDPAPRWR